MGALLETMPDDDFWNNEMFEDSEGDEEYESESEEEDVVDADFDDPEPDVTEEPVVEPPTKPARRTKTSKRAYVDPMTKKPSGAAPKRKRQARTVAERPTKLRKSRRASSVAASVESERRQMIEAQKKAMRSKRPRTKRTYRKLTQEELLEEAVETERLNNISLEKLIHQEAKNKPKVFAIRRVDPPLLRFQSKKEGDTITYVGLSPPKKAEAPQEIPPHTCQVTGERAKYLDPKTGKWFSSVEAFRAIRAGAGSNE